MEQLRGHTAYHLFKNNRRGSAVQTFSCGSVSAEMAIRSASAGTSTTLGFTNQRDGDFSETRRMQDRRGGDGREFLIAKRHLATMRRRGISEWRWEDPLRISPPNLRGEVGRGQEKEDGPTGA